MIERRIIENTNISVSNLGFGTASLHHLFCLNDRLRLLDRVYDSGITHFDTSHYYGYGLAETDLGRFHNNKEITISTKIGLYPNGSYSNSAISVWQKKIVGKVFDKLTKPNIDFSIRKAELSINSSLKRLKRDYIDFLLIHEPDIRMINGDEMLRFFEEQILRGKILSFGVAGEKSKVEDVINNIPFLCRIIQTRDSLVNLDANFLEKYNRRLQFTYGYLSKRNNISTNFNPMVTMIKALKRNNTGCVLFSTNEINHLDQILAVNE